MTKTKELTLTTDLGALAKEITANGKKHAALDKEWQRLGLSALKAFADHGNVFYINAIYKAMGKGARHVAYTAWVTGFGGVSANTGEGKDVTPFLKDANKKVDMEGAMGTPWYNMKPSQKPDETLDYLKLCLAVLSKKPKEGQQVAHADIKAKLQAIVEEASAQGEEDTANAEEKSEG